MATNLPVAIINGIHHFAAEKLKEEIEKNEIEVIGVENADDLEEYGKEVKYVFDFMGEEKVWEMGFLLEAKVTVVTVNDKNLAELIKGRLSEKLGNWRLVEAYGVYGPGMTVVDEEGDGVEFLVKALRQAVNNENLVLPDLRARFRLLCVDDLVEGILRASFLSGTEGCKYLVVGNELDSKDVAGTLIDEAKMTRYKVLQENILTREWNNEEIDQNRKRLKWEPRVIFPEGIKETLRYFFEKIDEEKRRKKEISPSPLHQGRTDALRKGGKDPLKSSDEIIVGEREENNRKMFDVIVEEEKQKLNTRLGDGQIKYQEIEVGEEKKEEVAEGTPRIKEEVLVEDREEQEAEEIEEIEEAEEEPVVGKKIDFDELKPLIVKNANARPVVKEEEEEKEEIPFLRQGGDENKEEKKSKKINFNFLWGIVVILIIALLWTPVSWGWTVYKTASNVQKVMILVADKKYNEAEILAVESYNQIKNIDEQVDNFGFNKVKWFRGGQSILKVAKGVLTLEKELIKLGQSGTMISEAVFKDKEIDWEKETGNLKTSLLELGADIGVLQARLEGDWSWLPTRWRGSLTKGKEELMGIREDVEISSKLIKVLPEILGTDGKRRDYMVLLQNENELRPGGGFIGSYGILSFEGGKLLNFEIKDIYEADGQLKGHVEPPEEIKNYLGEAGWYMRDANFSASFKQVSKDIQWFLDKETGRRVDGVVGVNLAVVKQLLALTGEIYVPDFKEKINKDNLYEQAEFYAETKFFPGSTQKASFLSGVGKELFEKVRTLDSRGQLKLYRALLSLAERNEVQVALNDSKAAKGMADLGWDGAIYEGKCGIGNCFADYLYIVEANFGVNKANYFLYRNIEQVVDINKQMLSRVLKINYENTAKNNNWPGGDYKNYLRIYVPYTANLAQVRVYDTNQPSLVKTYEAGELKIKQVGGKKEIGFLVTVPVLKRRTVEVRYTDGINLENKEKFSYLHYIQRQSGFGDTGIVNLISFPEGWQPNQVQPAATVVGGKLLFNQKLEKDIKMGVEISK